MELLLLYALLFVAFLKIGVFGFGGGYAILSLIQHEVVEKHQWLSLADFTEIVAISQTTPGTISFNSATYVGYMAVMEQGYGIVPAIIGSFFCSVAVALPSLILVTIVMNMYVRFQTSPYITNILSILKKATIGLIASAAILLMGKDNFPEISSWIIFATIFLLSLKKVNPILLIILVAIFSYFYYG